MDPMQNGRKDGHISFVWIPQNNCIYKYPTNSVGEPNKNIIESNYFPNGSKQIENILRVFRIFVANLIVSIASQTNYS